MLKIENLERKQGKFLLSDIHFTLQDGYLAAVLGPNGAGKSTLFQSIMVPSKKDKGLILWDGRDIRKEREWFLSKTAFISDYVTFVKSITANENVRLLGGFYKNMDYKLFEKYMKEMDVSPLHTMEGMSRGQFICFQLAFARARHARLYMLDEPTAGMDPAFRMEFYNILREILNEEATILMSTHIQSDVNRNCDYLLRLSEGKQIHFGENFGEEVECTEVEIW